MQGTLFDVSPFPEERGLSTSPYRVVYAGSEELKVSLEDYDVMVGSKWRANKDGYPQTGLKKRTRRTLGVSQITWMSHQLVMFLVDRELYWSKMASGYTIDHIYGDRFDCRRDQLRYLTRSDQARNRNRFKGRYPGVYRSGSRWRANVAYKNQRFARGFPDEASAIRWAEQVRAELESGESPEGGNP